MPQYTYHFKDLDNMKVALVGGKAANLAQLCQVPGVQVPDGFCIGTEAFLKTIVEGSSVLKSIDELSRLGMDEQDKIKRISREIRDTIQNTAVPEPIRCEIKQQLLKLGEGDAYAIRSSATAEDLPTTSFAGQHDTFLNVIGYEAVLEHVSKCWASLFTERAIMYRLQYGFDHRSVQLAIVVQKMIFPKVSGIMFTADPVTGNRNVVSIEASFGLGEALVSGIVDADNYKVREGKILERKVRGKKLAIVAAERGGTTTQALAPELQAVQALSEQQVVALAQIGKQVEAHFGSPQDIEWCFENDIFFIVQSRPITTLYPVPQANNRTNRVYLSVGHQQMMTDAMKPLGLSIWQLIAGRPMFEAGSRLFVDVTQMLTTAGGRELLLVNMEQFDPLIRDALTTVIARDFIEILPNEGASSPSHKYTEKKEHAAAPDSKIVHELISESQQSLEALARDIRTRSGEALFDFIKGDITELTRRISDPKSMEIIMSAIYASAWINNKMSEWLREKNPADVLSQSVSNNVTSEMGLQLLDVADAVRAYPNVVAYLQQATNDDFLQGLLNREGGRDAFTAIENFLRKYGMRCAGEIDITKPRWSEKPSTLLPLILNYVKNTKAGERKRKFETGLNAALEKERELLKRLRQLPDGEHKAMEAKKRIDIIRTLSGYREYPKYSIVSRLFIYKKALLKEAQRLVEKGIIQVKDDIAYLTFNELCEVVKTNNVDSNLIGDRKERHKLHERLTPPRVITSEGEVITSHYKKENVPAHAIVGLAVSSGVIEGRARVILSLEEADLEEGDILITTFTDPSWTPVFLSVKGLVTEVGGLMTHGAVIAREYGLPAVVGVENATKLIKNGQSIRLNGTDGYIEIL